MLTKEEWDALEYADQQTRQDEKPEGAQDKQAPAQPTIEELSSSVKDLTTKLDTLTKERDGVIGDLQSERNLRQQLTETVNQLREQLASQGKVDPLAGKSDDEFVTIADVKKLLASVKKTADEDDKTRVDQEVRDRMSHNYVTDEERMRGRTDLSVPYKEVVEEFNNLKTSNPNLWRSFWRSIHTEAVSIDGKPAELCYRLMLTTDAFKGKIETKARENLIKNLESEGKLKKVTKLPPGGGSGEIDASTLSEEQLINLDDKTLEGLLKKTG